MLSDTQENNQEKLPLDARLLSEAVIELNISRRSVGLYPSDHPIVKESIERAFSKLQKLFDIRTSITLGIAGDTLVVDEYKLDRKNPVFREFANLFHSKGIAAITFSSGLSKEELTGVHELITLKDAPTGKDFIEKSKARNLVHVVLSPLDFNSFKFMEGARKQGAADNDIWADYLYALVEGKLSSDDEAQGLFSSVPPEEVSRVVNKVMADGGSADAYDRVITSYLKQKEGSKTSSESYRKFISFVDNLSPELKKQFLSRSFSHVTNNIDEVERMITDMTVEDFSRIARVFEENSLIIPDTIKNLIIRLSSIKKSDFGNAGLNSQDNAVIDDVELGEDIIKLFNEDHFNSYVSEAYQRELNDMLVKFSGPRDLKLVVLKGECREDVIDKAMLGIMIELLDFSHISNADYLDLLSRLSEYAHFFIETGRFEEVLDVYNTLVSHCLNGRFKDSALSMCEYFFHSEYFTSIFIEAMRLWGRKDREGAFRLARALKRSVTGPLVDILVSEPEASMRKFFLSLLQSLGSDVCPFVVKKLNDKRWYVLRNMLCLLRECGSRSHAPYARKFAKHRNVCVSLEAVKMLLHLKTSDAVEYLKLFLQSENADLRRGAVKLSGAYKVMEALPYLVRKIEKKDIFGTESGSKLDAVKALGEIGDRSAVRTLLKLYHSRSIFYTGSLEELKVEVFRTLDNYPLDSIQELLAAGLRSANEEIRALSEKLLSKSASDQGVEGR